MSSVSADFVVEAGEFSVHSVIEAAPGITVLFGPSGSGKSLTLAVISGLRRPSVGSVHLNDVLVANAATKFHMRTQDRGVGMVFQDSLLLPHLSASENVALAVRDSSRRVRVDRAGQVLSLVGAAAFGNASPKRLSGGERQRIALARALAGGASVLLLDEPFSALDFETRSTMRSLLRSVVRETGVTALLVTHDVEEAEELADATIAMHRGATKPKVAGFTRQ